MFVIEGLFMIKWCIICQIKPRHCELTRENVCSEFQDGTDVGRFFTQKGHYKGKYRFFSSISSPD